MAISLGYGFGPDLDIFGTMGTTGIGGGLSIPPIPSNGGGVGVWDAQGPSLIAGGLSVIQSIFGNPANIAAARQPQYVQTPVNYQTQVRNSSGVGIGVDGQGVRLSDGSHIGWFPIAGVGLAFVLLQSKGFSRR